MVKNGLILLFFMSDLKFQDLLLINVLFFFLVQRHILVIVKCLNRKSDFVLMTNCH